MLAAQPICRGKSIVKCDYSCEKAQQSPPSMIPAMIDKQRQ